MVRYILINIFEVDDKYRKNGKRVIPVGFDLVNIMGDTARIILLNE